MEAFLPRCLESLTAQTYKSLEIVVVDDRSSDNTGAIIDKYAAEDSRLKAIHLPENGGLHVARRAGIVTCSGAYIGFVDADDWVDPRMFERMVRSSIETRSDIAICGVEVVSENGTHLSDKVRFRRFKSITDGVLARFCQLEFGSGTLWNKLYRSELIRQFMAKQLPRAVDSGADYIVNVGCFGAAHCVAFIPEQLYKYVDRQESMSRSISNAGAFVRTLQAYEVCLLIYQDRGDEFLSEVDELYARQLKMPCYQVTRLSELDPYEEALREILGSLAGVRPQSVYSLLHKFYQLGARDRAANSWPKPFGYLPSFARRAHRFTSALRNRYRG